MEQIQFTTFTKFYTAKLFAALIYGASMKVFLLLAFTLFSLPSFASLNEILGKPEHADCLEAYQALSDVQIMTTSSCATCTSYFISGKNEQERSVIIEAHEQRYGYRGGYQNVTSCTVRYLN